MDNSEKTENGIELYFHCKKCLLGRKISRVAVGWTKKGVQAWCETCDTNIVALDFKGQKVDYDGNPKQS